jgi:hypothetical protein
MVSVAIWLVSRARNFTHALLVFANLGAENGFTPDESEAMQCVLGFACATGENLTDVRYACVKNPAWSQPPGVFPRRPFWPRTMGHREIGDCSEIAVDIPPMTIKRDLRASGEPSVFRSLSTGTNYSMSP